MECRTYLWLNWVDSILECVQGSDLALCVWPKLNKLTPVDIENGCANSIDKSTWVRKRAWRAQAAGEGRGGDITVKLMDSELHGIAAVFLATAPDTSSFLQPQSSQAGLEGLDLRKEVAF